MDPIPSAPSSVAAPTGLPVAAGPRSGGPPAIRPWAAGLEALRRFLRPFVTIQLAAVALVVAYKSSLRVQVACAAAADVRIRGGLAFSAVSSAVAAGLLPELLKWGFGPRAYRLRGRGGEIAFNTIFFAFNGVVIDLFYRGLARLFGSEATLATVVGKVAFDQFVFTPLWLPVIVVLFAWRRSGFRAATTARAVAPRFYRTRVIPLLLTNWAFWMPMTAAIYSLPGPLQFLLFALALAAWSLIMVFIAAADPGAARREPAIGLSPDSH